MNLPSLVGGSDTWSIIKIMFLVGMLLYLFFAYIVLRQITHMSKTLKVGFEGPITVLGIVHLVCAIGIFILAFFVL